MPRPCGPRCPVHIATQLRCCDPRGATSCGSPMPRAEQIANPTERDLRLVGFFYRKRTADPPAHRGRPHVQTYARARPGRAHRRGLRHRPPVPDRRARRVHRDRGVQRRQVLGGRRNGKLERAGDRPGSGSASARDQRDASVRVSRARSVPRRRGGTGSPWAAPPGRCGYRWRFGRRAELVLPRQRRPARSPAFNAALAEVRQISDTRTQEQIDIANYWNVNQSPRSQTAFMGIARELIVSHHRSDAEAARIMFLMSAAAFDALIGCFDAKYHYWFIRPPQADAGIHTVFPTPQHPSYPSAHSCFSGAYSGVLAAAFPSERARLAAVAQEASLSRLYAGIHYRFDFETGLELGGRAAALALAADLDQVAPGTR